MEAQDPRSGVRGKPPVIATAVRESSRTAAFEKDVTALCRCPRSVAAVSGRCHPRTLDSRTWTRRRRSFRPAAGGRGWRAGSPDRSRPILGHLASRMRLVSPAGTRRRSHPGRLTWLTHALDLVSTQHVGERILCAGWVPRSCGVTHRRGYAAAQYRRVSSWCRSATTHGRQPPVTPEPYLGHRQDGYCGRRWSQSWWNCPPTWSQFGRSSASRRQAATPSQAAELR
jgi:hypothetical protein